MKVATHDGSSTVGRILDSTDEDVVLEVDGAKHTLDLADVAQAHIQIEFNRPQRPRGDGAGSDGHEEG